MELSSTSLPGGQSPFTIPHEDVELLSQSKGFQLLRRILANQASFCAQHSNCDKQAQETWLLHRDILHALIMPVVELYKRASALAGAALCTQKSEDLELAFAGDARGSFLWLQCFLSEADDWCGTKGCPACITIETLSTESHIRLTIAASLLSTASISSPNSSPATSTASSPTSENLPTQPDDGNGLSLPPLPHILPALREALDQDAFWGPMHWSYLFSRATQLSAGVQALITSCGDLDSLVSSPTLERPTATRSGTIPGILLPIGNREEEKGVKLKRSKLAKRQLRMKNEEVEIIRRAAWQCWAKAAVPSKMRNQLLGKGDRRRSLTCP
ncbi:hypothetical protein K491DRAFT_692899 [Lophiostoma macrostomum CBS 122681]|uniref:Uncharacterized protein n=1 Tax=Lophiostoma macrostomum CBS 122681 TaxID=1314788 RepID=A0A6A6T918_9PLEO|nr:hypothetical protein K491DRAFT_692899 [Lophiostoma macrostomum CBS 122681]